MVLPDPERLLAASRRFKAFFDELRGAFLEREDVLHQMALALVAKEHVLLSGPPGTAKSQLASAVLGRVVCESSGQASLFARQITESTVQTDLIGPIDFKNLTETGRTTHFTDEGMLGSAHAFLDEVFDGRDMLLRSALNVLQERELKQGNVITRGRIECALMTSNRTIAEVLDDSRETLLAFVDRIAFIGFVPRGFSNPDELRKILRHRMNAGGKLALDALLTIQDLDVLQAAAESVYVAPELCDLVAQLLTTFDSEIAAATRADPAFTPTRYISTRTAVRGVTLLRSICLLQKIFTQPSRQLAADHTDVAWLRLHLLLSGPSLDQANKILEREVDPSERRQLTLLIKEREIFDGCVRRLTVPTLTPKPKARVTPPPLPAASAAGAASKKSRPPPPPADPLRVVEDRIVRATASGAAKDLVAIIAELAPQTREGAYERDRAQTLLKRATAAIAAEGLRAIMRLPLPTQALVDTIGGIVDVATTIEDGSASMHPTARWLHEQALVLLEQAAVFATGLNATAIGELDKDGAYDPAGRTTRTLRAMAEIASLRTRLLSQAASRGLEPNGPSWEVVLSRLEADLAALWTRGFADAASEFGSSRGLGSLLTALGPHLERLDNVALEIAEVTGRPSALKDLVVGPRLLPLVEFALSGVDLSDRARLLKEVQEIALALSRHGLSRAVTLPSWLSVVARALERAEPAATVDAPTTTDLDGYRRLRSGEQRTPITCTLIEIALILDPVRAAEARPDSSIALPSLIELLDPKLQERVVELDLARIRRGVGYLEMWWRNLAPADARTPTDTERDAIRRSRILEVIWDEAALARFALETRLLEQILVRSSAELEAERARVESLYESIRAAGLGWVEQRADQVWARATEGR